MDDAEPVRGGVVERTFMGAVPPIQINARDCGSVTIRVIYEERTPDSLRRWAERLERDRLIGIKN